MTKDLSLNQPIYNRVLALHGGGAKGVYTLGFLSRLENMIGAPLHTRFDLIYGTSTGSIIAALISLGTPVDEIYGLYLKHVPHILSPWFAGQRTKRLEKATEELLKGRSWSDLKVKTGIVATNWNLKRPLVFKSFSGMAHAGKDAFLPGFGATLSDAIRASCAAVPLFKPVPIKLKNFGDDVIYAYDGGYCANNPALFALVDFSSLDFSPQHTALFSIGVGHYSEPCEITVPRLVMKCGKILSSVKLLGGVLEASSNTNGILQKLIMKEVRSIRADDVFPPEVGVDLLETSIPKLRKLFASGSRTFQENENKIRELI